MLWVRRRSQAPRLRSGRPGAGSAGQEQGLSLTGPDGLLKQFTKTVPETALNEKMTEHLGHEKNRAPDERDSAHVRSGTRACQATALCDIADLADPLDEDLPDGMTSEGARHAQRRYWEQLKGRRVMSKESRPSIDATELLPAWGTRQPRHFPDANLILLHGRESGPGGQRRCPSSGANRECC